jgi:hypothetical protein
MYFYWPNIFKSLISFAHFVMLEVEGFTYGEELRDVFWCLDYLNLSKQTLKDIKQITLV